MNPVTLNQNLEARRNDEFYVEFLSLPSNQSNILGRQVKEVDFPIINFTPIELKHKTNIQKHNTIASFDEISIQFEDDISGITIRILYEILYKQADNTQKLFDIRVKLIDYDGKVTSTLLMRECFIVTVAQSQLSYQGTERSNISVTFAYYNIDFGDITDNIQSKLSYFDTVRDKISLPPSIISSAMYQDDAVLVQPPLFLSTANGHAGTMAATDGTNIMTISNTTANMSVGLLSDIGVATRTFTLPLLSGPASGIAYGEGVWMVINSTTVSYWSDDLGVTWNLGTGYAPAFNTFNALHYSKRFGRFLFGLHQPGYSLDGKVKSQGSPQTSLAITGYQEIAFKDDIINYFFYTQGRAWYNFGSDYDNNWVALPIAVNIDMYSVASDGNIIVAVYGSQANSARCEIATSTDGKVFSSYLATNIKTITQPRHIMRRNNEWVLILYSGTVYTSTDLLTWTNKGTSFLTTSSSGITESYQHPLENHSIIRYGDNDSKMAIIFKDQISYSN